MTSQGLESSEWGARAQEAHDSQGQVKFLSQLPGPGNPPPGVRAPWLPCAAWARVLHSELSGPLRGHAISLPLEHVS